MVKPRNRLNSLKKLLNWVVLIRAVNSICIKTKPHQY